MRRRGREERGGYSAGRYTGPLPPPPEGWAPGGYTPGRTVDLDNIPQPQPQPGPAPGGGPIVAESLPPLDIDVERLRLEPGDILCLTIEGQYNGTQEVMDRIKDEAKAALLDAGHPDVKVLVLWGVKASVISS